MIWKSSLWLLQWHPNRRSNTLKFSLHSAKIRTTATSNSSLDRSSTQLKDEKWQIFSSKLNCRSLQRNIRFLWLEKRHFHCKRDHQPENLSERGPEKNVMPLRKQHDWAVLIWPNLASCQYETKSKEYQWNFIGLIILLRVKLFIFPILEKELLSQKNSPITRFSYSRSWTPWEVHGHRKVSHRSRRCISHPNFTSINIHCTYWHRTTPFWEAAFLGNWDSQIRTFWETIYLWSDHLDKQVSWVLAFLGNWGFSHSILGKGTSHTWIFCESAVEAGFSESYKPLEFWTPWEAAF